MLNFLLKKFDAGITLLKQHDDMPKVVILNVKVKESRNWHKLGDFHT